MPPRYTLKIITDFAASHSLRDYPGDCQRLHGHNWKVEVEISAGQLDALGMVLDFKALKSDTQQIVKELDHHYLNEIPPFDQINPTAENIAAFIYTELAERLSQPHISIEAITLWETERASVRYTED
jgi:6-pyruvoyltetrahydropterin/6-carboxytetrahydropterin synthase